MLACVRLRRSIAGWRGALRGRTHLTEKAFGEWQDPTLGWTYLRSRWLDTSTGRFQSRDPWEGSTWDPGSLHRYTYAHLDPVINSDPSGEFTLVEGLVALSIATILVGAVVIPEIQGSNRPCAKSWAECFGPCVERRAAAFWQFIMFSAVPKRVVPPFRVPSPSSPMTTPLSVLSHYTRASRTVFALQVSRAMRQFGRAASRFATPLVIVEGLYDWYVISRCAFACQAEPCHREGCQNPSDPGCSDECNPDQPVGDEESCSECTA